MKKLLTLLVVASLAFTSCKKETKEVALSKEEIEKEQVEIAETEKLFTSKDCTFKIDTENVLVKWTAFKTNARIGVGGQFDSVNVTASDTLSSVNDMLSSISFTIETASTNTNNSDRDKKIVESFFGSMKDTKLITGSILKAEGNQTAGMCTILLKLNGIEKEVHLTYSATKESISLVGAMTLEEFDGLGAIDSLNKVCEALHTGDDGESKTWADVDLNITIPLSPDCN